VLVWASLLERGATCRPVASATVASRATGDYGGCVIGTRVLCIGISSFTDPEDAPSGDDEEPDLPEFPPLDFAVRQTRELQTVMANAGYAVTCLTDDSSRLTARELGQRVIEHLEEGGVTLVHVLSHGRLGHSGQVYVIGSDARHHHDTDPAGWCQMVTDTFHGPTSLFLLDLCHAGAATGAETGHWRPPEPGQKQRAWVIAATGAATPAYGGRLTRAATTVLNRISAGETDIADSVRYVGFHDLYRWIAAEVLRLADLEDGHIQHVRCTPTEGAPPELPFFPNPRYQPPSGAQLLAAQVDQGTVNFLDPVLDAIHFRVRAAGHGTSSRRISGGAFSGRAPQIGQISVAIQQVGRRVVARRRW